MKYKIGDLVSGVFMGVEFTSVIAGIKDGKYLIEAGEKPCFIIGEEHILAVVLKENRPSTKHAVEPQIKDIIIEVAKVFYFNGSMDAGCFGFDFNSPAFNKWVTSKYVEILKIMESGK